MTEPVIEPGEGSIHAGMDDVAGLDHHHVGSAAVLVMVVQPAERHALSLAGSAADREGGNSVVFQFDCGNASAAPASE
jgi:hypothetical protein